MMKKIRNTFSLVVVCLIISSSYASQRYWVGNGSNLNWNSTSNWSGTSGGSSGSSVPGSSDTAYFDGNGTGQCSLNANVSVRRWEIQSGFNDTIKQNSYTVTVSNASTVGGFVISDGVFYGGSGAITINNAMTISGGTFISTSGTLLFYGGTVTYSSGTFSHNNGHVTAENTISFSGDMNFYDFEIKYISGIPCYLTISGSSVETVEHDYTTTGTGIVSVTGTGRLDAKGDIYLANTSTTGFTTTGTIKICGTSNQTIYGTSSSLKSRLCNVIVDKASDTLFLKDYITCCKDFTYTQGYIDVAKYTNTLVVLSGSNGVSNHVSGSFTLDNLEVNGSYTGTTVALGSSDSITVLGTFKTSGSVTVYMNNGAVLAQGDITIENTATTGGGGSLITYVCGTGTQHLYGQTDSSYYNRGWFNNINVNKSAGTLYLHNTIPINGDYIYTAGTVDYSTYNSTLSFIYLTSNISGGIALNNLIVANYSSSGTTLQVSGTDTLTVNGWMKLTAGNDIYINGKYKLLGDFRTYNTSPYTSAGGGGTLIFSGTGDQNMIGISTKGLGRLCSVKIDKPSGTLYLKNNLKIGGYWTYVKGDLDATTYNSTVAFANGIHKISGTHALNNVSFYAVGYGEHDTIRAGDTLTVLGDMYYEGSQYITLNGGTVNIKGNFYQSNNPSTVNGDGLLLFSGTGNQTIEGNTSAVAMLPDITIDKPSGTLYLKNIIYMGLSSDWRVKNGTVDAITYQSTLLFGGSFTRSIEGKQDLYNLTFNGALTTIHSLDTLTVHGELKFTGSVVNSLQGAPIIALGDVTCTNTVTSVPTQTGEIIIAGDTTQTLTGSGILDAGKFCSITIDKSSGNLFLKSIISVQNNWKYLHGNVIPGNSVVNCYGNFSLNAENAGVTMDFNTINFKTGTTTLGGNLNLLGDLLVNSSTTLAANGKKIQIAGNWSNNGAFTSSNAHVVLNGLKSQWLLQSSGSITFDTLTMNKPVSVALFNKPLVINEKLNLNQGYLASSATNTLVFSDDALVSGASDSSYVSGPVKKNGNDDFVFPLGDTLLTSGAYHPLTITAPSNTSDAFTAQYFSANQAYGDSLDLDSLENISTCEYFDLIRNAGSSTVIPSISWNSNSCNVDQVDDLRMAYWDGTSSLWKSMGNGGVTIIDENRGMLKSPVALGVATGHLVIGKFKYPSNQCAVLKRELDGGFNIVSNGHLYFKYDEEYNDVDNKLTFNIYNEYHTVVATNSGMPSALQPSVFFRDNRYDLNILNCAFSPSGYLGNGFFILEVINEKNEKRYLRFKHVVTYAVVCPGVVGDPK